MWLWATCDLCQGNQCLWKFISKTWIIELSYFSKVYCCFLIRLNYYTSTHFSTHFCLFLISISGFILSVSWVLHPSKNFPNTLIPKFCLQNISAIVLEFHFFIVTFVQPPSSLVSLDLWWCTLLSIL